MAWHVLNSAKTNPSQKGWSIGGLSIEGSSAVVRDLEASSAGRGIAFSEGIGS